METTTIWIPIKKPRFNGKYPKFFFFVAHIISMDAKKIQTPSQGCSRGSRCESGVPGGILRLGKRTGNIRED